MTSSFVVMALHQKLPPQKLCVIMHVNYENCESVNRELMIELAFNKITTSCTCSEYTPVLKIQMGVLFFRI